MPYIPEITIGLKYSKVLKDSLRALGRRFKSL